jgi:hypothetical protein
MDEIDDLRMGDRAEALQVPQFSCWATCGFVELFQQGFSLYNEHLRDVVLQFAIACLRSVNTGPANWPMFQKLLLLCVIPEPACLPYVLEQIIVRRNAGAGPILGQMEEIANDLIQNHSSLKHSSEVANAVWACLALRLQISDKAVHAVSQSQPEVYKH